MTMNDNTRDSNKLISDQRLQPPYYSREEIPIPLPTHQNHTCFNVTVLIYCDNCGCFYEPFYEELSFPLNVKRARVCQWLCVGSVTGAWSLSRIAQAQTL